MITWKNMDTLASYQELRSVQPVNLAAAMTGENGAVRVKTYTAPMGAGLASPTKPPLPPLSWTGAPG